MVIVDIIVDILKINCLIINNWANISRILRSYTVTISLYFRC